MGEQEQDQEHFKSFAHVNSALVHSVNLLHAQGTDMEIKKKKQNETRTHGRKYW